MENQPHAQHKDHTLHYLAAGTALVTGAVILAPYALPFFDIGTGERALEIMSSMMHNTVSTGLAGVVNSGLAAVPLIGGMLAGGGFAGAAISGAVGIGGVLLGRYLEKKHHGKQGINWGKIIKYGALLTSALIALPSILTGLSIGITYLSFAFGDMELANAAGTFMQATLGCIDMPNAYSFGLSGVAAALPHFLTCGLPIVPAVMSYFLSGDDEPPNFAARTQNILQPEQKYSDGSIAAKIVMDAPIRAGIPATGQLLLTHSASGAPLADDELAVVHTRKTHLFVVDESLKDYQHIHPIPTETPGVFAFSFTPKTNHSYSAWADVTSIANNKNHRLKIPLSHTGRTISATIKPSRTAQLGDLTFEWKSDALRKDTPSIVEVVVRDVKGNVVEDLEPVMGTFAHLVGFSKDGASLIHTHPLGAEPTSENERGQGRLRFHVEPDCEGLTQFYVQVKRGGQELFAPIGQNISPPALATQRVSKHEGYAHVHAH